MRRQDREGNSAIGTRPHMIRNEHAEVRFSELYSAYELWADAAREYKTSERKFADAVKKRPELKTKRKKGQVYYAGIALEDQEKQPKIDPQEVLTRAGVAEGSRNQSF